MRYLTGLTALFLFPVIIGCSSNTPNPEAHYASTQSLVINAAYDSQPETVLLVSLDDGSVIKQLIDSDADICFKQISSSATTCLSEGAPIVDSATNTIIGVEMIEDHIELVARPD